ncbi:hypothetical protein LG284_08530 [Citricoccus nitrophenolicus]
MADGPVTLKEFLAGSLVCQTRPVGADDVEGGVEDRVGEGSPALVGVVVAEEYACAFLPADSGNEIPETNRTMGPAMTNRPTAMTAVRASVKRVDRMDADHS